MEENSRLREAEAKLAGHDNHKQKIHILEKKKAEIDALKTEMCDLKAQLLKANEVRYPMIKI